MQGVLHELPTAEMRTLSFIEGGYDVRDVLVECGDSSVAQAKAFMINWSARLFEESVPTKDYIRKLRSGAADFGLSDEYQVQPSY